MGSGLGGEGGGDLFDFWELENAQILRTKKIEGISIESEN
jgi:hypothetical protein